ncbi:MAG: class I SAM-dependent methyltransferase [Acidiferrobacterales bacterium]|jgi:ubiquinone/menaquinone biosynthesis C-methylase UbiE|nr:class I SAM-dependent methyltransferase [Acidiferrobacterales bacterium]
MSASENQPDWNKIAEKFDMWLPQLAPVGEALIEQLQAKPGDRILDLASGTGEPALSLARQMAGEIEVIGVDAAEGMVRVANKKVKDLGLNNIRFETMPAEALTFDANSFDRVLCRFGVMLFEDSLQGLKEMFRVLKPGGHFALAVWSTPETMPTMHWSYKVMAPRLPQELHPPVAKVTSLGGPGVLEDMLFKAGFSDFTIETKTFNYNFDSFDAYWDHVEASDILKMQYDALPEEARKEVRNEIGKLARDFIVDGQLVVPHDFHLAWGSK